MIIFCDTGFFVAYYNSADQYHLKAVQLLRYSRKENYELHTSDYVYDETLTRLLTSDPNVGYLRAYKFDRDTYNKSKLTFTHVSDAIFLQAREKFFLYNKDKQWSFTDCTSFALMEDYGIRDVLTFDQNFKQMGFRIVGV